MAANTHRNLWYKNLAKPEGMMGQMVGEYLARENYELNMWAVHTLQIQEGEKILEIGFGPGISIEEMAKTTSAELIAGIDISELMVAKAAKRNARAVEQGKVDLRQGNVTEPPDFGTLFNKIIVINNVMYWPDTIESLRKVRGLLDSNGLITLIIQRNDEMYLKGQCNEEINWYAHCLRMAGFVNVGVFAQPVTLQRKLGQSVLAGIAIYGFSPVACQVLPQEDYGTRCESLLADLLNRPSGAKTLGLLSRQTKRSVKRDLRRGVLEGNSKL